jgi:uncharacterized protein YcbK (DUF882 family)
MARRFALPLLIWLGLLFNISGANAKKPRRSSRAKPTPSRVSAAKAEPNKAKKRRVQNKATKRTRRRAKRDLWPPMTLAHVNTRERLKVRLYDRRGRTVKASVRRIWHLLRCHHTGKRRPIHWRLVSHLYKISRHYKGKTLRIYSGYRSPRVSYLGRRSKHTVGRAVDFAVDGVSTRSLRDYLRRTFKSCGIGYYPNTQFVHLDIRKKPAFWVDYSGKGEDPRYANPYEVLRRERLVARGLVAKNQQDRTAPAASTAAPSARPSVAATAASPARQAPASQPAAVEGPPPVGPAPQHQAEKRPPDRPPAALPKARKSPVSNVRGAP